MTKKKTPIAEYIMLDRNNIEDSDFLTVFSDTYMEYQYVGGYTYTLKDTGNGFVFTAGGKEIAILDFSEAAALRHMLGVHNKDGALCSLVRYKLVKDEK